jgi:ribosome recycling factor
MTEEIEFILDSTKESMTGSIAHLEKEFLNIRAGKASPAMLGSVLLIITDQQHHFLKYQN